MFTKQKVSRVAAALASLVMCGAAAATDTIGGDITASATLTDACEVTGTKLIDFGSFTGLGSTTAKNSGTAGTFLVACTSGLTPGLSGAATRQMTGAVSLATIPFTLNLGGTDLSSDSALPTPIPAYISDGTAKPVTVSGQIAAIDIVGKPADSYSGTVAMTVTY